MATMIVQFQVKDFTQWKTVFEMGDGLRKENGEKSHTIYQDADDPNSVTNIMEWDSLDKGKAFFQSAELRAKLAESGMIGAPKISYLKKS